MPAYVHYNSGPCNIIWGGVELGFTEDGVQLQVMPRWHDIFSDDMGGREGVPSDSQFLGATAFCQMLFSKYIKTRMDQLASYDARKVATPNVGVMPVLGSFVRQDSLYAALALRSVNDTLTFATAFLRGNYELNSGTKARRYFCGFELWLNQTDLDALTSAQTRRMFTLSA